MQFPLNSKINAAIDLGPVQFAPSLHIPSANIRSSSLANAAYATNVKSGVLL